MKYRELLYILLASAGSLGCYVVALALVEDEAVVYGILALTGGASLLAFAHYVWRCGMSPRGTVLLILQAAFTYWYLIPLLQTGLRRQFVLGSLPAHATTSSLLKAAAAVEVARLVCTGVYLLIVRLTGSRPASCTSRMRRHRQVAFSVVGVHLCLGLLPFGLFTADFLDSISGGRAAGGKYDQYAEQGAGLSTFLFSYFLSSAALLAANRLVLDRRRIPRIIAAALTVVSVACVIGSQGTRSLLISLLFPALTLMLLRTRPRWSLRRTLQAGLIVAGIWLVTEYTARWRMVGFYHPEARPVELTGNRVFIDNDFFSELVYAIQVVPDQLDYSFESPVLCVVMGVIPRAAWPDRPYIQAALEVMRIRLGAEPVKGNVLPGIVGQYWIVAGWIGVSILGCWLGVFGSLADTVLARSRNEHVHYLILALAWAMFIGFRAVATSLFIPAALCGSTMLVVAACTRRRAYSETVSSSRARGDLSSLSSKGRRTEGRPPLAYDTRSGNS
jgi:hypothetical protein